MYLEEFNYGLDAVRIFVVFVCLLGNVLLNVRLYLDINVEKYESITLYLLMKQWEVVIVSLHSLTVSVISTESLRYPITNDKIS